MRITDGMRLNDALATEARTSQQMYNLTQEASSGYKVNAPSDDPAAYASIVSLDSKIAILGARGTAATQASNDLSTADDVLSSASDVLVQAKQTALEMSNGTVDPTSRAAAAATIDGLSQSLLAIANTQGSNGYLFGGTATGAPPFGATGNFVGNSGTTQIEVADGVTAQTNVSGAAAFTAAGGRDIFADLQALSSALTSNNLPGITAGISNLASDNSQIIAARVSAGELGDRLQSSSTVIANATTEEQTQLADTQDADVAQVYSEFEASQTSYESALSVTKQILSLPTVLQS
jgi:flagellar hook-associated protein 3 FlgL